MAVLASEVARDETFERRRGWMEGLVAELRERTALVAAGGGEKSVERHRSRGKLTARERIDRLIDPGTAFLELNALAAWELYDGEGRLLLPADREEAPPGTGGRPPEPAAEHLPRRLGRGVPPAAGRGLP